MWKLKLVIAISFITCPTFAVSRDITANTDSASQTIECSQEEFNVAENRFRERLFRGSPEKLLKGLVDGCPNAFWIDRAKSHLFTVEEERANSLIKIAQYYQRLFIAGKANSNRGATSRYELILADYPHYSRTDYVLLILGNAYSSTGESEKAFSIHTRLINEFPTSKYVRNAYKQIHGFR